MTSWKTGLVSYFWCAAVATTGIQWWAFTLGIPPPVTHEASVLIVAVLLSAAGLILLSGLYVLAESVGGPFLVCGHQTAFVVAGREGHFCSACGGWTAMPGRA